jgi:hypothetical protein
MHGRVRIARDLTTKEDYVRRFDGTPLRSLAAMGSGEKQPIFSTAPAMSLSAFEAAVAAAVAREGRVR